MNLDALLETIPPLAVYVVVGVVIGVESLGIPLPGEIVLVSAALLSSRHTLDINPVDGRSRSHHWCSHWGHHRLLGRSALRDGAIRATGEALPQALRPRPCGAGQAVFTRWGVWAVFFGRFIALLRILAGPLAGALKMRYPHFLAANASGGLIWAGGTTAVVYYAGLAAERWLSRFSWIALVVAVVIGIGSR